jgi:type II secretory pathway component PulC
MSSSSLQKEYSRKVVCLHVHKYVRLLDQSKISLFLKGVVFAYCEKIPLKVCLKNLSKQFYLKMSSFPSTKSNLMRIVLM